MTAGELIIEVLTEAGVDVSDETREMLNGYAGLQTSVEFCNDVMAVEYTPIREVVGEWQAVKTGETLRRIAIMAVPLSVTVAEQQ